MSEESKLFAMGVEAQIAMGQSSKLSNEALTEAARQVDTIHISLAGMTAIMLFLLFAVAMPVFGFVPVTSIFSFVIMCAATIAGIGYLYYLNYGVHSLVSDQARLTEVLVNSLGQGFLAFGPDGVCEKVYSQACIDLLQTVPADKHIMEVLRVPEEGHADFKEWLEVLFMPDHALGFQDVVNFFPHFFSHSGERRVVLMYRPIYDKEGALERVVLIATDQTEEFAAQELARQRQEYADMICRIFRERNQFMATIAHVRRFIEESAQPVKRSEASSLLRMLHTLKAAVKHFHFNELGDTVHLLEAELRNENITTDEEFRTILLAGRKRVEDCLKDVFANTKDIIGQDYEKRGNMHEIEEGVLYNFALLMKDSGVRSDVIDHYLRSIVAVPAQDCFRQFERELIDLAEFTGKQIKPVRFTGSNPSVLMRAMHPMIFSLTHIARNIIDHGIEPPVTRLAHNKDPAGQITVHIDVESVGDKPLQRLFISISDDGGGIDPARVRGKLMATAPDGAWRNQNDHAVIQNIFSWGFSTRDTVTDLSGRGVGMEAVEREIKTLGGSIEVFSSLFQGTRFEIRVPYTLQI